MDLTIVGPPNVAGIGIAFEFKLKLGAVCQQASLHLKITIQAISFNKDMRLEFEPNVTAMPLIENELFDEVDVSYAPDLHSVLKSGIAAAQNGEREAARNLLMQATEIDPHSEDAWMWLASISDYPEELLAFLTNVLTINPVNARAVKWMTETRSLLAKTFVQRGIDAHVEGSGELAMQCVDQALAYDEGSELAWSWKARIAKGDDQRVACLRRVLEINPGNDEARTALTTMAKTRAKMALDEAKTAAATGKRKRAIAIIADVLETDPSNIEAWILRSHFSVGLHDKLVSLEKALEIDPENTMARSSYDFLAATPVVIRQAADEKAVEPQDVDDRQAARDKQHFDADVADAVMENAETLAYDAPHASESPRRAEELFGPIEEIVDATRETIDSLQPLLSALKIETTPAEPAFAEYPSDEVHEVDTTISDALSLDALAEIAPALNPPAARMDAGTCPYCSAENEVNVFECNSCHAALSLSDIEALLSNPKADRDLIQRSVANMETEWDLREFDHRELTALGIGHLNLRNFDQGQKYLHEALRRDPNNVILAGQINTIAIRLEEMRRQDEVNEARPVGKTILVVDDSPTVRKLIAGKLEKSGHNVICAVDGVEGLAKIAEGLPDLVLLDISMPRMDGYDVCKEIRSNPAASDLPVVMISGKDGFFDKVRGKMAGATGYVTKPFGPETLMKALETYLVPETAPEQ